MQTLLKSPKVIKAAFFLSIVLAFMPLLMFLIINQNYYFFYKVPAVDNGALDVSQCDFTQSRGIPLYGAWEFFGGSVRQDIGLADTPAQTATVPRKWNEHKIREQALSAPGLCFYRVRVQNCPGNIPLTVYIPNISEAYRVYLNGVLVSSRSAQAFGDPAQQDARKWDIYSEYREGIALPAGSEAEVVVELISEHIGGLYMAPVLVDADLDAHRSEMRRFVVSAYTGILVLCIVWFAAILFAKDRSFSSSALLVMDGLIVARMLIMDEFHQITRLILPFFNQYDANAILQACTLFLPVVFMIVAVQMFQVAFEKKHIFFVAMYETAFSAAVLWCALSGRPILQNIFCAFSYLPAIYVLHKLYLCIKRGVPYSFLVSGILIASMASIIGANLKASGLLVFNISLFAPSCFVISILLQLTMIVRKNQEMQRKAMQAETLALQLRDSQNSLMLSQIKPHFLYNTLIAIHMLCQEAPAEAAEAVLTFADYLRSNMRSIGSDKLIPFSQELAHINNYVAIEKLRFDQRLTFQTDVQETEFCIPPLVVQPIVENAIKHGACKNITGGTVLLHTYALEDAYYIEVKDDGPGFDPAILDQPSADSFGLKNIIFRLKERIGAQVDIQSVKDEGTRVLVRVPKEEAHASNSN